MSLIVKPAAMVTRALKASVGLLDYLFVENCRICKQLIAQGSSRALTVCESCWKPLEEQEIEIDSCGSSSSEAISVAHAASYESSMKLLIHRLKYDGDRLIARDLSLLLLKACDAIKEKLPEPENFVLVPIPLSGWRKLQRGFNQSELLAGYLKQSRQLSLATRILFRRKHTRPQHRLNRQERAVNVEGAFRCAVNAAHLQDARIILVDDIHTSGATLAEAAQTLSESGVRQIAAITVARAKLG
jgi:ComF family protein